MREICPFAVPVREGFDPPVPFCRATGQSIKAKFGSPTGYQKCDWCRTDNTTQFCELTVEKEEFVRVSGRQGE